MKRERAIPIVLAISYALLISGCGLFDSGEEWRSGPYALIWIDLRNEVTLSYDMGQGVWGTLIEPQVFAVGADKKYVVAKQHPNGRKDRTNYFIVEMQVGQSWAVIEDAVVGPLSEQSYREKAAALKLPPFTKVLEPLQ
jgi:hypothetical protein